MTEERLRTYLLGFVVGGGAVLVGCMIIWVGLYLWQAKGMHEINLPLIIITGVVFLLTVLGSLAFSFSALGLANKDEALGLPSGSVRAVIALMLLVIFAIVAIYSFSVVFAKNPDAGIDLAKQLIVLVGTLVTAVSSFYFGSSSIAAVTKPPVSSDGPVASAPKPAPTDVVPTSIKVGAGAQLLAVTGANLGNVNKVELKSADGKTSIPADVGSVKSGPTTVTCNVTVPATTSTGSYEVIVSDGAGNAVPIPKKVITISAT